jgi:hypothetical protein
VPEVPFAEHESAFADLAVPGIPTGAGKQGRARIGHKIDEFRWKVVLN